MRNPPRPHVFFFAIFLILALALTIFQVVISEKRPLAPVESTIPAFVVLLFSTVSGWYFSKKYSAKPDKDSVVQDWIKMLDASQEVGLESVEPEMKKGTKTTDLLNEVSSSYAYFGVSGAKFVHQMCDERTIPGKFVAENQAPLNIRMMFLDPDSLVLDTCLKDQAPKLRDDIRKSLRILARQIQKGRKIDVRLYDYSPPIRIQIVNKRKAVIGHLYFRTKGWDSPQLRFVDKGHQSLMFMVNRLYEHSWDTGKEFEYVK